MRRTLALAAAALLTLAVSSPSFAAHCRDAKGKFAKCGTPGAKPI